MKTSEKLIPKLRFSEFEDDWKKNKVIELADCIVPGRNKPKEFGGNIPWITTPDIEHNGIVLISKKGLAISREEAKKVGAKIVPSNSVIISCVGELGLTAITGVEMVINQQLHAFIPKESIENRFLLYSISNQKKYMDKVATKTAVPYMNKDNCNSIPVIYPSLPEQQKIASFLIDVDAKITKLTKKKTLLEQYKKGVMQKIFNQELRFKDDDGNNFPDWESKSLGEVATKQSSNISANTIEDNIGNYKIYGASGFLKKIDFYRESEPYVSIVKDGAGVGRTLLCDAYSSVLGTLDIIKPKKSVNLYFIYCLLNNLNFLKFITGSTIPHIYFKDYSTVKIKIPCLKEQTKIANFLSDIDVKTEALNTKIENSKTFKKGLLQKMFV